MQLGFSWVDLRSDLDTFGLKISSSYEILKCKDIVLELPLVLLKHGLLDVTEVVLYFLAWIATFDLKEGVALDLYLADQISGTLDIIRVPKETDCGSRCLGA